MDKIKSLNYKWGAVKRQLTNFYNFAVACTDNLAALEERYKVAPEFWKKFEELHLEIECNLAEAGGTDYDKHVESGEKYENLYYEALGICKQKLSTSKVADPMQTMLAEMQLLNEGQQQFALQLQRQQQDQGGDLQVRLPKLTIQPFGGEYDKWLSFKDAFTKGVHDKNLPGIQKFLLLKGLLKDNALRVISALEATDENYTTAWELIVKRYENTRLLINIHLKGLFELSSLSKPNSNVLRNLVDEVRSHVRSLESLKQPVDQWGTILIFLISNKLDHNTREEWEKYISTEKDDRDEEEAGDHGIEDLLEYLDKRSATLEVIERNKPKFSSNATPTSSAHRKNERTVMMTTTVSCNYCNKQHLIYKCEDYLKLTPSERLAAAFKLRLCTNCLKVGHIGKDCKLDKCKKCDYKHNTLLHGGKIVRQEGGRVQNSTTANTETSAEENIRQVELKGTTIATHCVSQKNICVILSTAQVYVKDADGKLQRGRALLDTGAQANLMTEDFAKRLGIPFTRTQVPVGTVSKASMIIRKSIRVEMSSTTSSFKTYVDCLILPSITEELPQSRIDGSRICISKELDLADPEFDSPGPIDILVGAGLYWRLIKHGETIVKRNSPVLQNTKLGWIIGGQMISNSHPEKQMVHLMPLKTLEQKIEQFWNVEELEANPVKGHEETLCEELFKSTYTRDESGRFQVELPKRDEVILGNSFDGAMKRFFSLEKRLDKQPELKKLYIDFLRDYEATGHMSVSTAEMSSRKERFFLPHQPVLRSSSLTTKLRVVFDASAQTSLGPSLNDKLMAGPNLQNNLLDILLRFRMHEYVITADIAKMFRQIFVADKDKGLQQILWRESVSDPIRTYTLNTVTYGTTSAPYLALRCLRELAALERSNFPEAAEVLESDFYMDDLLSGADTIENAAKLQQQLMELLARGQFQLRKWRSNNSEVLCNLVSSERVDDMLVLRCQDNMKTLGLLWNNNEDTLQYQIRKPERNPTSKRKILSAIAAIYDPLGLIGPVIMYAKCLMQELWALKLSWDEEVPKDIEEKWKMFCESLQQMESLAISRNVNVGNKSIIIHGFSDASGKGYGACVYVLSYDQDKPQVNLLCAKSRVKPLKQKTIPKLELAAAVLLANLVSVVTKALKTKVREIHLWSDSTIVLYWIVTPVSNLKTFQANKVTIIQELMPGVKWRHVPTKDNPADIVSRGVLVDKLVDSNLWWHGPEWLPFESDWPVSTIHPKGEDLDLKLTVATFCKYEQHEILRKYGKILKLVRVIAYCYRFYEILRIARLIRKAQENKVNDTELTLLRGALTVEELEQARICVLRWTQEEVFGTEIEDLQAGKWVNHNSKLRPLKPYLDDNRLIRVGGRLEKANLSESQKHPIILPAKHHITTLILRAEHQRLMHCGPNCLLSAIRSVYWPLSGIREARKITKGCIPCFRYRPKIPNYVMADLPESRVRETTRPFDFTGVDYAGPLQVRESRRRGRIHSSKGYIAIFVCFTTKAVHLELVSDLTSEAFLAAFRRFVARRGLCRVIHSDHATNFVGASRELEEVYKFLVDHERDITDSLASRNITWKFIPPRSPHFGGLWEAAVKSVKKHLYTVTKGLSYTFEEYGTLLTEIESVLNSRPLMPVSSDPNDLTCLTPSHFLLGCSAQEPVSKSYLSVQTNRLSRWQHLQKIKQDLWKRWSSEYLHQLQTRTKWNSGECKLEPDMLVLVIEENQPPLQWVLGRIVNLYPGTDGVVRVADVRIGKGIFKRAVKKLCILPMDDKLKLH